MAATHRLTFNKAFGRLDAVLPGSSTTMTAGFLAALGTISDPNYLPVVLGDGLPGTPLEVVWVIQHAAGATTATVLRGQEGTDPTQVWDEGTPAGERITTWDLLLQHAALADVPAALHYGGRAFLGTIKRLVTKTPSGLLSGIYAPPGGHGIGLSAPTGQTVGAEHVQMRIAGAYQANPDGSGLLTVPLASGGFPNAVDAFTAMRTEGGSQGMFVISGTGPNTKTTISLRLTNLNGTPFTQGANIMYDAVGH